MRWRVKFAAEWVIIRAHRLAATALRRHDHDGECSCGCPVFGCPPCGRGRSTVKTAREES